LVQLPSSCLCQALTTLSHRCSQGKAHQAAVFKPLLSILSSRRDNVWDPKLHQSP
jgi:hypothetical protein